MEDDKAIKFIGTLDADFNPRPPCGGRLGFFTSLMQLVQFQSTSPVWRTTRGDSKSENHRSYFNPRPPCGGRRDLQQEDGQTLDISIHVPRVEDDRKSVVKWLDDTNFNPRPPCGGRRQSELPKLDSALFQSTSPVWRTTRYNYIYGMEF